jgi:DNA ligase-1
MKLDTLYKRTKTGAIQFWEIEVLNDESFMDERFPRIIKTSGQLGTENPIKHIESVKQGKNIGKANETTPNEQAESQARSDWQKKRDEGYKSMEDLADNRGFDVSNLYDWLNARLPQFNTDASGNVKPMLATDWNKVKNITYPCYIQPKLDGVRCLMIVSIDDEGVSHCKFLSRSGKEYTTLQHIADEVLPYSYSYLRQFILDGEIYSDELSFQQIVAAVKKQCPDSLKLHFRAYDIVNDDLQSKRWPAVVDLVDRIKSPYIWPVTTFVISDKHEVKLHHDDWVKEGYEGAMLRLFDGVYGQGQRSSHLLKVKEFDETEFAFKNFEFGQRGVEDLLAVCWTEDGKEFRAKVIGTKAQKEVLYQDSTLEGKSFTVKHFGWTEDKLPRFPIGKGFRNYE